MLQNFSLKTSPKLWLRKFATFISKMLLNFMKLREIIVTKFHEINCNFILILYFAK
jgi:hypothetical protein